MSPIKLAIAVLASTSLLGAQRIVDAVKDFSVAVNPNGVWSYGATTSKGLNFARFSAKTSSTCLAKSSWGVNALSALSVGKNMGDKPVKCGNVIYPTDALAMHPGARGERAVLRWTAPKDGQLRISSEFTALDRASSDVRVIWNGFEIFNAKLSAKGQWRRFAQTMTVYKGTTIDFAVGHGGDNNATDATSLSASVEYDTGVRIIGAGCKGSGGFTPTISYSGAAQVGSSNFAILMTNALGGRGVIAGLVIGRSEVQFGALRLPLPLNNSCTLFAAPEIVDFKVVAGSSGAGKGSLKTPMPIPNCACMIDQTFFFQWLVLDPAQRPVVLSNAMRLMLQ